MDMAETGNGLARTPARSVAYSAEAVSTTSILRYSARKAYLAEMITMAVDPFGLARRRWADKNPTWLAHDFTTEAGRVHVTSLLEARDDLLFVHRAKIYDVAPRATASPTSDLVEVIYWEARTWGGSWGAEKVIHLLEDRGDECTPGAALHILKQVADRHPYHFVMLSDGVYALKEQQ